MWRNARCVWSLQGTNWEFHKHDCAYFRLTVKKLRFRKLPRLTLGASKLLFSGSIFFLKSLLFFFNIVNGIFNAYGSRKKYPKTILRIIHEIQNFPLPHSGEVALLSACHCKIFHPPDVTIWSNISVVIPNPLRPSVDMWSKRPGHEQAAE